MNPVTIFLIVSTIVFAMLFTVWRHEDWANAFVKFVMLVLFGTGAVLSLMQLGFLVRA